MTQHEFTVNVQSEPSLIIPIFFSFTLPSCPFHTFILFHSTLAWKSFLCNKGLSYYVTMDSLWNHTILYFIRAADWSMNSYCTYVCIRHAPECSVQYYSLHILTFVREMLSCLRGHFQVKHPHFMLYNFPSSSHVHLIPFAFFFSFVDHLYAIMGCLTLHPWIVDTIR